MFQFKQFTIHQDLCAMKVGTDGVLLGAWAEGGNHVLDVGTGTGVIALMMAQRYPDAQVTGLDIDEGAVLQARQNVSASPFRDRVEVLHETIQHFASQPSSFTPQPSSFIPQPSFDSIVSNPPFFMDSLRAPDRQRNTARHADTLSYDELMRSAFQLLSDDGTISVIVPSDYRRRMDDAALFAGLFPCRVCAVSTKEGKPPRRFLLAYSKHPRPFQPSLLTIGSEAYRHLTQDFYL